MACCGRGSHGHDFKNSPTLCHDSKEVERYVLDLSDPIGELPLWHPRRLRPVCSSCSAEAFAEQAASSEFALISRLCYSKSPASLHFLG